MSESQSNPGIIGWWKIVVLQNYANFEGRARRSEYWYFVLANLLTNLSFYVLMALFLFADIAFLSTVTYLILLVVSLGLMIPGLAVAVRRLHDINKSGWSLFFGLIPLVGPILIIVWLATEGNKGENQYGLDPKAEQHQFEFEAQTA